MNRSPVRIEHGRQVNELAADKSRQQQDDGGQRQRDRGEEAKILAVRDEQSCDARAEGKSEAQVVKIGEGDVTENPAHLTQAPLL